MNRFLLVILILSVPIIGYMLYTNSAIFPRTMSQKELALITFNQKTPLRVMVASTTADLQHGLSDRAALSPTEGMLFVFDKDDYQGIWMKDMNFPIDIVWLDKNGIIVDYAQNVKPDTYPKVFEPKVPARFVIETSAYFIESFVIKVGDHVEIPESVLPQDLRKQ